MIEDSGEPFERCDEHRQRELDEDRSDGAPKHNDRGCRLQNLAEIPAFQKQSDDDAANSDQEPGEGRLVH